MLDLALNLALRRETWLTIIVAGGAGLLGQLVGSAAGGAIMGAVSSAIENGSPISGALVGSVSSMLSTVRGFASVFTHGFTYHSSSF